MRDRKIETLVYKGLGFPIKLIDVPMKKMFGDWVIDINMAQLQFVVLRALMYKPTRLTEDELKFIRHFFVFNYHCIWQELNKDRSATTPRRRQDGGEAPHPKKTRRY
jgi:hypothetical protein